MTIPVGFMARYAIPLVIAAVYLTDVDIPAELELSIKTQRLADQVLSEARKEGELDKNGKVESFDYIIVGGGSAGAVLANKLSASGIDKVLLLEAGGDPPPIIDVPYAQKYIWGSKSLDWEYSSVAQSRACLNNGGRCIYPRGKVLGGSSSVNGLFYNRCKPKDYDLWANFTGDQSWSWSNIKETFNKLEDYHGFYEESAGANHGYGGEMYVGTIDYLPGLEVMEEALREKGYPIGDANGGEDFTYGFSKVDYNIKNGLRWGTHQAFLEPVLNRTNLIIYRYAHAIKIETESVAGNKIRAAGVIYERHGAIRTATVTKEVILSGGVFGSPQLLMLSGIGPADHLEDLQIPVVLDLPVGKYLQDHPGLDIVGDKGGFFLNTTFGKEYNTTESVLEFIENGTGPLNGFSYEYGYAPQLMQGYLTNRDNPDKTWPQVHVYIHEQYFPEEDKEQFYFALELARVSSTGTIKLASSNPNDKPLIDPNFFENSTDVNLLIDVIEEVIDLFLTSEIFQKYDIQNIDVYGRCEDNEFQSKDYWKCFIADTGVSSFHPTSTCRMGPDPSVAVTDSKLRVFGTENLRVIDASSMPFVPSGNTNLPAMLVAARGAELILSGQ